ncbi:MAG: hypothetical protein A2V85_14090 [Chloroflexi bacterium RBG_16_72_14]|nr:MAG: hypothetical protein A2V85_14090 [Chloroflexi bacterium RBG_16_72_14]
MTRFATEQTIARPAADVWTYAADILRHPEWMSVTDARIVRGSGTETGARGRERMRLGPLGWDVEFEVADADPGRRIAWRAVSGAPFELEVSLDLEPVGPSSTRATYGADIRLRGLWRLLGPLLAMEGKTGPARELARLKSRAEGGSLMA